MRNHNIDLLIVRILDIMYLDLQGMAYMLSVEETCIRNGLGTGIEATKVGLPLDLTKGTLGFVMPLTGCGGI